MEDKSTGVEYPTIELNGTVHTIKFTRAMFYRMGKAGVVFNPVFTGNSAKIDFHVLVDVMKLAIGFTGSSDELAEMLFDKRDEALRLLVDAWGNLVLPSLKLRAKETAAPIQQVQ